MRPDYAQGTSIFAQEPDKARALNVPTQLLAALERHRDAGLGEPLLIQLSTDQVYDGTKAWWREDDECQPVNGYGRSKLEAEAEIARRWRRHAILRSSIIVGPLPPFAPVGRTLFLQFIDEVLANKARSPGACLGFCRV